MFSAVLLIAMLSCTETPAPPNIIVLYTDDQRADCLGCAGHPLLKTPNIDRLAAEGAYFQNSFVTTSICCISRASLITGRLCRTHKVGDFSTPLPPEVLAATFPAIMRNAGYRTGCFGKWGIGGRPPEGVFDVWDAWGGQGEFFHKVDGRKVHNSEYLTIRAEEFLRGCKAGQPFCLLVYYKSPHDPYQPDPRDLDLFREVKMPIPKTATMEHFLKMPEFIRKSEGYTRAQKAHPTPETYQEFVRQYLRCIAGVDRSVGKILQLLDELKLNDSTIIVFSSDNGFFLGEHGLSHKWLMHEESIRVPLIIRDPRMPAQRRGVRVREMALNIDVAPTLLDLAGLKIPPGTDGTALRPLLTGEPTLWRTHFFYEHHFHFNGRIPRTEGIRTAEWSWMTYFDVNPPFEELYDLKNDPLQERNLAADAGYRQRLNEMREIHRKETARLPPAVVPPMKK